MENRSTCCTIPFSLVLNNNIRISGTARYEFPIWHIVVKVLDVYNCTEATFLIRYSHGMGIKSGECNFLRICTRI